MDHHVRGPAARPRPRGGACRDLGGRRGAAEAVALPERRVARGLRAPARGRREMKRGARGTPPDIFTSIRGRARDGARRRSMRTAPASAASGLAGDLGAFAPGLREADRNRLLPALHLAAGTAGLELTALHLVHGLLDLLAGT